MLAPNLAEKLLVVCAKCDRASSSPLHRHHKGHEKLLALMFPDAWQARYNEFREEDCTKLCEDCHYEITALHSIIVYGMMDKKYEFTWPSLEEALQLRKALAKLTEWWIRHG